MALDGLCCDRVEEEMINMVCRRQSTAQEKVMIQQNVSISVNKVVLKLYQILDSVEHKIKYYGALLTTIVPFFHTMVVNSAPDLFYHILPNIFYNVSQNN